MSDASSYGGWAIVELMGHRRLGGKVSEVDQYGVTMLRIDIPRGDGSVTQFYGGHALYSVTPCDESAARTANGYIAAVGLLGSRPKDDDEDPLDGLDDEPEDDEGPP